MGWRLHGSLIGSLTQGKCRGGKRLPEHGSNVGHIGYQVAFVLHHSLYLRQERSIAVGLGAAGKSQFFGHSVLSLHLDGLEVHLLLGLLTREGEVETCGFGAHATL